MNWRGIMLPGWEKRAVNTAAQTALAILVVIPQTGSDWLNVLYAVALATGMSLLQSAAGRDVVEALPGVRVPRLPGVVKDGIAIGGQVAGEVLSEIERKQNAFREALRGGRG